MRPAIDLVYRAIVRAATEIPDRQIGWHAASGRRRVAHAGGSATRAAHSPLSRRSRSRRPSRAGERRHDLVRLAARSSPPAISSRGRARHARRRARAAAGAAGSRARRAAAGGHRAACIHGSASRAQVEAAHLESRRRWRARSRARRSTLSRVVVEREHRREAEPRGGDREHARAGAEVEQRRRAARLPRGELEQQLEAQPRGRVRAGAERLPRVDHDLLAAAPALGAARRLPRRAHVQRAARARAPAGAWRVDEHGPVELASSARPSRRRPRSCETSTSASPAAAVQVGQRRQLAGRAVDGVLDDVLAERRPPRRPPGASSSSSASTSSACSRRTRTREADHAAWLPNARRSFANIDSSRAQVVLGQRVGQLLAGARAARALRRRGHDAR